MLNKMCFMSNRRKNIVKTFNLCVRSIHNASTYQKVADAYAGKSVFLTGGTGFLGKVLIESLLYNCRDIESIYLLMRKKKESSIEQRLKEMFNAPLFDRLRTTRPADFNKVIGIEGDLVMPQLGIKASDQEELEDKVSFVIHSGAAVKFNDKFQNIFSANYDGTKNMIDFGKRMRKLETFVHVSTTYANLEKGVIEEVIYPYPVNINEVRKFIAEHGDDFKKTMNFLERMLRYEGAPITEKGSFNTYTFSKKLAESLLDEERGDMPTIMVRPAQVTAMYGPPLPGWMESWIAAPSFFSDAGAGSVTVALGDDSVICNLVPVDYACNLIIVAAARGNKSKEVLVYNGCTSLANPVTWKFCIDSFVEAGSRDSEIKNKRPLKKFILTQSEVLMYILIFIREIIPTLLADFSLILQGKKPRHMSSKRRAWLLRYMIKGDTRKTFTVKTEQSQALAKSLDEGDKKKFPCDLTQIKWPEYIHVIRSGIQKFMLNKK